MAEQDVNLIGLVDLLQNVLLVDVVLNDRQFFRTGETTFDGGHQIGGSRQRWVSTDQDPLGGPLAQIGSSHCEKGTGYVKHASLLGEEAGLPTKIGNKSGHWELIKKVVGNNIDDLVKSQN